MSGSRAGPCLVTYVGTDHRAPIKLAPSNRTQRRLTLWRVLKLHIDTAYTLGLSIRAIRPRDIHTRHSAVPLTLASHVLHNVLVLGIVQQLLRRYHVEHQHGARRRIRCLLLLHRLIRRRMDAAHNEALLADFKAIKSFARQVRHSILMKLTKGHAT